MISNSNRTMRFPRSTPSFFSSWSSVSSSALLLVLLCLLSAHAQNLAEELWRPEAVAATAALIPPRFPTRRAWPPASLRDLHASQRTADPKSLAPSEEEDEVKAAEAVTDSKIVMRSAAAGRQSTSPTGSKLTAAKRTRQRNRLSGRRLTAHDSANESEKSVNHGDGSTSDVPPTTAVSWLHHRSHHHHQQQHGRSTSGHHLQDDSDDEEKEDDDEMDESDDAVFPLTANGGSLSAPSLLTFATSRAKGPRDRMLKSSKDALIVTKKSYLKKDWCKTEPLIQKVREPGCVTRTIVNNFCYGQCNSFYIPKNAKMDIESTAFKSCSFCKPKRFRWITITLHCPGLNPPYKRKRIQRIKKCKCISEILQ